MPPFPTGHQIYLALVQLLETRGVVEARADVDVTVVPENQTATYTVVPTERAKPELSKCLSELLGRPFALDDPSWVIEFDDTQKVLQAAGLKYPPA